MCGHSVIIVNERSKGGKGFVQVGRTLVVGLFKESGTGPERVDAQ